jgi:aminoglycoside phosphotransferase family enzyme/predicted kinase
LLDPSRERTIAMHLDSLIDALSRPDAYPHAVDTVDVRQTHISVVFLAGPFAYKLKKPINLGFLDFSTLARRDHYCHEEVRLNRRLAPAVYLGVFPITKTNGRISIDRPGELVDWAVKMTRLPETATLEQRLMRGEIDATRVEQVATILARFHAMAERSDTISRFGRFDMVARNTRENFEQAAGEVGRTIHPAVFARLRDATEATLTRLKPIIDARAERKVTCDTHGDLHLDHVYLFPDRPPPDDLVVIDCIEFNERFRYADPVADMAFLAMDLAFHGRRDLAAAFADSYFRTAGDDVGRALLPFYVAYRAAVRGKVEGFELHEAEVPAAEKAAAATRAKAHWLLALGELAAPAEKPCLVLVGGLPGTGKSTLAAGLAEAANFAVIRSDVVRKEIAGHSKTEIYTTEWTERTYRECRRRAKTLLFEGKRVMIDATLHADVHRVAFLTVARQWGVPALWLDCRTDPETAKRRLGERTGDVSDATWEVYLAMARDWEPPSPTAAAVHVQVDTRETDQPVRAATAALRAIGLF